MFVEQGIAHRVLNAKQDAGEALIVAQAGRLNSITIATSMAGRGTDILLGGNHEILKQYSSEQLKELNITEPVEGEREQVLEAGGLYVIGCERLDSQRLDLQLAGRSGRQGDPGCARFYVALDDPLMKDFGGEMLSNMFRSMGVSEADGLEHPMITKAITQAQSRKQALYVASRKQGLKQDSVIDKPRKVFFGLRNAILMADNESVLDIIADHVPQAMSQLVSVYLNNGKGFEEEWDYSSFSSKFAEWGMSKSWFENLYADYVKNGYNAVVYVERLVEWISFDLKARLNQFAEATHDIARQCMLMGIDRQWQIFLDESEQIRNGIHLRAYAQEKPEQAFQKEIFKLFNGLHDDLPVVMLDFAYRVIMDRERSMDEQLTEIDTNGASEVEESLVDEPQLIANPRAEEDPESGKKPEPEAVA
jgi:preprotein translocase subunit SecA